MRYKRLLALILSIVITSNTVLPAFATENVLEEIILDENVIAETKENEKSDVNEDVLSVQESISDEIRESNSSVLTESSAMSLRNNELGETADLIWSIDENFVLTISGNGNMQGESDVDYPWYEYSSEVTEIVIEEGITSVGQSAFESFYLLEKVTLPDSVVRIEESAFEWCDTLSEINFPEQLNYIGEYSFSECYSLSDVKFPDTLVTIGESAFEYCEALERITVPSSTKNIGAGCFSDCSGLKEVTVLSDELTELKMYLFFGCTELKTVKIPKNVTVIQQDVFGDCDSLEKVYYGGTERTWNKMIYRGEEPDSNKVLFDVSVEFATKDKVSFAGGNGTKENPYLVANGDQLDIVREDLKANYLQIADIDISDREWKPIGYWYYSEDYIDFQGTYDGQNYKITGMTITENSATNSSYGFVAYNNGVIQNVNLQNTHIDLTISNFSPESDDNLGDLMIAGIVGWNKGAIVGCSNDGSINVNAKWSDWYVLVGGIVGDGNCEECVNSANIFVSASAKQNSIELMCGGITGHAGGVHREISDCVNYGNITVQTPVSHEISNTLYCGGITGQYGCLKNCVNFGCISGTVDGEYNATPVCCVGGLSGYRYGTYSDLNLNCINFGNVYAHNTSKITTVYAGGLYGEGGGLEGEKCYNLAKYVLADKHEIYNDEYECENGRVTGFGNGDGCYSIDSTTINNPVSEWASHGTLMTEGEIYAAIEDILLELGITIPEYAEYQSGVKFLSEWDAENKIAYFGDNVLEIGSIVTEETDISFIENIDNLLGKYVYVKTKNREDELIDYNYLISIEPVETKAGTVNNVGDEKITIDNTEYACTVDGLSLSSNLDGKYIMYHLYDNQVVGLELLECDTGYLNNYDAQDCKVKIDQSEYIVSEFAQVNYKNLLEQNISKRIKYYYDNRKFLYRVDNITSEEDTTEFNPYIYKANYLLTEHPDNLDYFVSYINNNSPTKVILQAQPIEDMSALWQGVTLGIESAMDASKLLKYHFEQDDIYLAILIDALEGSLPTKSLGDDIKTIWKTESKIIGNLDDTINNFYNFKLATNESFSKLTAEGKKNVKKILKESLEEGAVSGLIMDLKAASKVGDELIEISDSIESFANNVLAYQTIYSLSESMAMVIQEMYEQTPTSSYYMRKALKNCLDIINASTEEYLNKMLDGAFVSAGEYGIVKTISHFWGDLTNYACTLEPALGILILVYKSSKAVTNFLGNSDDISEKTFKISVVNQYYTVLNSTITELSKQFRNDRTQKNAEAVISALELLFELSIQDCKLSYDYVDSVSDAALYKIKHWLVKKGWISQTQSDAEDARRYIDSTRNTYNTMYSKAETFWIYRLEDDYPEYYWDYAELIGKEKPLVVPITEYSIKCPVNVKVYDKFDNVVAYLSDGKSYASGNITVFRDGNHKYIEIYDNETYKILCDGYDDGTMDILVTEYACDNVIRDVAFYNLDVANGLSYEIHNKNESLDSDIVLLKEHQSLAPDYDSKMILGEDASVHIKVEGGYIETELGPVFEIDAYPGKQLTICAVVPDGNEFVGWHDEKLIFSTNIKEEYVVSSEAVLNAVIENTGTYKISYYDAQESLELEPKTFSNDKGTELPILSKEGYRFLGWSTSDNFDEETIIKVKAGTSKNLDLYASWKEIIEYEEFAIEKTGAQEYTGAQIKPKPIVFDGNDILTLGKDYTLSYKNNIKTGMGQISIKGKGNYTKTITTEFEIVAKSLSDEDISVTCTDKLYNGKKQVSKPVVKWGGKTLKAGTDYTVEYSENQISVGEVKVIITGKGNYTGTIEDVYRITDKSISKTVIDKILTQYYTGKAIEPEIVLYANKAEQKKGNPLELNKDYKVAYENNIFAGKGKITVTGIGEFGGTKTITFTISKCSISSDNIDISFVTGGIQEEFSVIYTGKAQKPELMIMDGEIILEAGKDYSLSYSNNTVAAGTASKKKPTVTVKGLGDYSGTKKIYFNILPQDLGMAEDLEVIVADARHTGKAVKPSVTLKLNGKTLKKGTDYNILSYENNVELCEKSIDNGAYVRIKGIKNYTGEIQESFRIYSGNASGFVVDKIVTQEYTPYQKIEPEIVVYANKTDKNEGIALTKGTDYEVDYQNNEKVGTAKAIITGIGKYGGTKTVNFTISKRKFSTQDSFAQVYLEIQSDNMTYTGNALKPEVTVMDGLAFELIEGVDYTLSYSNNKNVATSSKKQPTVTVKGKGNYAGTLSQTFVIEPKNIADESIEVVVNDALFNQKKADSKNGITTTVTVKDGTKKLSTSNYKISSYRNNKTVGNDDNENAPTVVLEGKGNYTGILEVPFRIYKTAISKATEAKIPSVLYTGKALEPKPDLTMKVSKKETITLVEGEDYTLSWENNVKIGKGKVIITGIGEYGGSKTVTFTILPKWLKWF